MSTKKKEAKNVFCIVLFLTFGSILSSGEFCCLRSGSGEVDKNKIVSKQKWIAKTTVCTSARLSLHARQSCFYGLQEQNGVLCARHVLLYACIGISQQPRSQDPLLLGPRSERERPRRRGPWERERSIKAQKADVILI